MIERELRSVIGDRTRAVPARWLESDEGDNDVPEDEAVVSGVKLLPSGFGLPFFRVFPEGGLVILVRKFVFC